MNDQKEVNLALRVAIVAPTGYTLVTQRLRTPQRERESRERWFG